jgi:hypothetical protein
MIVDGYLPREGAQELAEQVLDVFGFGVVTRPCPTERSPGRP